jgi:hypothetical protein
MRILRLSIMAILILSTVSPMRGGQVVTQQPEMRQLKARQKIERKMLKGSQRNTRKSLQHPEVPGAERARLKRQMKRDKRELRQNQKDERNDLKDRRRLAREKVRAS